MSAASRTPTPPSSTPPPRTASSTSCANCWASKRWAGPCGWAHGTASCKRIRWPPAPMAQTEISERHRHRYEFNREYEALLTGAGLRISGATPDSTYVEIVELPGHPFFLGCQFHPEFKSKPLEPHPHLPRVHNCQLRQPPEASNIGAKRSFNSHQRAVILSGAQRSRRTCIYYSHGLIHRDALYQGTISQVRNSAKGVARSVRARLQSCRKG